MTPSSTPQALDLTPVPDPNADQRQTTLWLLLGTGSTVLALGMWGMIRRARRDRAGLTHVRDPVHHLGESTHDR